MTDSQTKNRKKRVVILGGGLGALTAAYYLSDTPELRDAYDVTIYQMGWRLGGKCASGRNPKIKYRIEEHGVHVFSGFYANTFGMLRQVYAALDRPAESPLSTCVGGPNPAFVAHNQLTLMEKVNEQWERWDFTFDPDPSAMPGERSHTLWQDLQELCRMVRQEYDQLSDEQKEELRHSAEPSGRFKQFVQQVLRKSGIKRPIEHEELFDSLANVSRLVGPRRDRTCCQNLCGLLKRLLSFLRAALQSPDDLSIDLRRPAMLIDLGLAIIKGVLKHQALQRGFDKLDRYDFADWLKMHGASPHVCDSPIVRALYTAVFAFQPQGKRKGRPRLAAGVALRVLRRTFLDFQGGFVWKMQAGMGETVIAPLYEVLKQRGVNFQFFHRVERLELSPDGKSIARLHLKRQVDLRVKEYEPLLRPEEDSNVDVPCWPSEPRYEQLEENQARHLREMKSSHRDLESAWMKGLRESDVYLEQAADGQPGEGFDAVVLGIPVGALPTICQDLTKRNAKWRRMLKAMKTTQTQSVQLWLTRSAVELGWKGASGEPLVVGLEKPLDGWVGMSQLIERENWTPADRVRHIAYFVGTAVDDQSLADQLLSPVTPESQHNMVMARARGFLDQDAKPLWPNAVTSTFDYGLLADPEGRAGSERLDAQYFRANVSPSDRYVLSLPGTTKYRLPSDQSGFANLFLAGDWTRNGLNVGSAEAAVMSGMQAARGISQRELSVFSERDSTLPSLSPCCRWWRRRRRNR